MESFNQRNSLRLFNPFYNEIGLKIVQSETFFPSLFFSPLPRGAKLVTSAENWIVSEGEEGARGQGAIGQSCGSSCIH